MITTSLALPQTHSAVNLCVQWSVQIQSQHVHTEESPCLLPAAFQCEVGALNDYKSVTPSPIRTTSWGGSDPSRERLMRVLQSTHVPRGKSHGTEKNRVAQCGSLPNDSDGHKWTPDQATGTRQHHVNWHLPGTWGCTLSKPSLTSLLDHLGCRGESIWNPILDRLFYAGIIVSTPASLKLLNRRRFVTALDSYSKSLDYLFFF